MKKIFWLMLLLGCAQQSYVIKKSELLPYPDSAEITKVKKTIDSVEIVDIQDMSSNAYLGMAYTGVEYYKTPIYLENSRAQLVRDYLSDSLSQRNIIITPDGQVKLSVQIKKFVVNELIEKHQPERAVCRIELALTALRNDKKWDGEVMTEFTSAGDLRDGTERLAPTLASCMNIIVEKLLHDQKFIDFLKKE